MQYAYNGKYFEYFEVGRTEMMRERNLTYKTIEANGYMMPVHSVFINYKNPAYYDELIEVETIVAKLPELKVHIDHVVTSTERGIIICEGYVELVFVKMSTMKISRPPEFFINAIQKYFK